MRLPKVIVPVLSSSSVSTSPAASTARPEVAMTLKRTSRSIPAMPMADRSPPIVVGMRQTSSAIKTVADRTVPEYLAIGHRLTQTIRKMMVSPASRIDSANSFGVFCRSAPSTNAIIRSMKVDPGAAVILTLMKSDSTVVPPVTADRSPPASRMTGADAPGIADSLTAARPSQSVGLRVSAPSGDGLGEIGEQHREPQPGGDLPGEQGGSVLGHKVADKEQ